MNNDILNTVVILCAVICAIITVSLKDTLSAIISMLAMGLFIALEFLRLNAPDVAIAEIAAGVIFIPVLFLITLKRVRGGKEQ